MAEVTPEKCNALYGDESGSITDSKRVDLTDAWETKNISLINSVAGDIGNAMAQFNREVDDFNQQSQTSGIQKFTSSQIAQYTDPRTWDYGGSDGYGEFGDNGEIITEIKFRSSVIQTIIDNTTDPDLINSLNNLKTILEPARFFGSSYSAIRDAYLERYQIDACYLQYEISINERIGGNVYDNQEAGIVNIGASDQAYAAADRS